MNCFLVPKKVNSPRHKSPPTVEQNIPTILESQDFSESVDKKNEDCVFEDSNSSSISQPGEASVRRLSFRLGSDAEDSNNSSSQRTTPSFTTGNFTFDFEHSGSRRSSTCSTPSPKLQSNTSTSMTPSALFLEIPRDPFQPSCGPLTITNSHSSDKLASGSNNRLLLTPADAPKLQISRSCNTLTKGIFGGGKGGSSSNNRSPMKWRRRSSNTDPEETSSKNADVSRKSSNNSDSDNAPNEQSIFARFLHRWQTQSEADTVPAHALFLKYNPNGSTNPLTKPSRSHSETEAVEGTVKHRLRDLVRRNTESVLKNKPSLRKEKSAYTKRNKTNFSNRPTSEEAASWSESFDNLLANTYGTALFRAFLQLEYNEENLAFYLTCEKFKRLDPAGTRKIAAKAQKIYDEFVRVEAPREVNMDSITRATTVTNLANPNRHCFDHAQRRVRHMLEKDVYPRFLKFELYTQLLTAENEEKLKS